MTKTQKICLILASAVVLVALFMLIRTLREYKAATDEYEDLSKYTKAAGQVSDVPMSDAADSLLADATETGDALETPICPRNPIRSDFPDLEVDLDGLREINSQVVCWLYVGAVGISYPVVQDPSDDKNEYYLHHTLEGKENSAGAIFMDWEVDPKLTSWNTFIYGHNMKNGSMFGSLRKFINNHGLYDKDPYIYLFRDEGIYRYKIYSYYLDTPDSKMYYTCDTLKEYRAYIRTALEKSVYDCNTPTTEEKNSVTLVTCAGSGAGKKRFFVHGIIQDRYLYPNSTEAK